MMLPEEDQLSGSQSYLRDAFRSARERNLTRLEELMREHKDSASIEATFTAGGWAKLVAEEDQRIWQEEQARLQQEAQEAERRQQMEQEQWEKQQGRKRSPAGCILRAAALILFVLVCSAAAFFFGRFSAGGREAIFSLGAASGTPAAGTQAATQEGGLDVSSTSAPVTPTLMPPTPTAAPTETPQPTATPFTSAYFLRPGEVLYPALPVQADSAWVLDDHDAIVEPPLSDTNIWAAAESQDAAAANEIYYTTSTGPATVTWQMDAPVSGGVYLLYVLDTLNGSGGAQPYIVSLDGQPAEPYRGTGQVIFNTAQFGGQAADMWLPIGAYQVAPGQVLSVQASVEPRSEEAPFAIDRLLIVKLSWEAEQMLAGLPIERVVYSLADDPQAAYYRAADDELTQLTEDLQPASLPGGVLAWNGSFKRWSEPWQTDMAVQWAPVGRLPAGEYELYIWLPGEHATARGELQLLADGVLVARESPAPLVQADFGNQWLSMGIWRLPQEAAVSVRFRVAQDSNLLADGSQAEIGADAVALAYVGP